MEKKDKVKYSEFLAVRINPEMRSALERLAEQEERPAGMMARILLREAIEAREAKGSRKKGKKPSQEE
jgi:predicted transcriptional regulator